MITRSDFFGFLVVALILMLVTKMYMESETANLKCIVSSKDGDKYCVRDRKDLPEAADLLAGVRSKLGRLVENLKTNHNQKPEAKKIVESFDNIRFVETLPTSVHTAYSENKGEKIALCLNKNAKIGDKKLIDPNTLMFVALHELSHVGTESEGHEPEFWNNFKFLLQEATKLGLYQPVDYKKEPAPYCGDKLTDSPLFDL